MSYLCGFSNTHALTGRRGRRPSGEDCHSPDSLWLLKHPRTYWQEKTEDRQSADSPPVSGSGNVASHALPRCPAQDTENRLWLLKHPRTYCQEKTAQHKTWVAAAAARWLPHVLNRCGLGLLPWTRATPMHQCPGLSGCVAGLHSLYPFFSCCCQPSWLLVW